MLMFGIVAVPVEWFCFHSFQKKKARGIAKKVRRTEAERLGLIPIENVSHTPRANRENPARVRLMIASGKSEFDRFRPIFMTSTLVGRTKGFVRG